MVIGITHFDYICECGHNAKADVPTHEYDADSSGAYRLGNKIECPECGYKLKKITGEKVTRDDNVVSEVKDSRPDPAHPKVVE